jgi:hypothetical protein
MTEYLQHSIMSIKKTFRRRSIYRNPFTAQDYELIADYLLLDDANKSIVKILIDCGRAVYRKDQMPLSLNDYK